MTSTVPAPVIDRAPGIVSDVEAAHDGVGVTHVRRINGTQSAGFNILIWDFPSGSVEGLHDHLGDGVGLETYTVLDGGIRVTVDGAVHDLTVGDVISIPPACLRAVANVRDAAARLLLVFERPPGT